MMESSIFWDDEDNNNTNKGIKISFSCVLLASLTGCTKTQN